MHFGHCRRGTLPARTALLLLLMPGTLVWAQDDLQIDAGMAFLSGQVDGHVQTPAGGKLGTTSPGRPTLEELGIRSVSGGDFWATISRGHHGLYGGGRILHLSGDGTLDDPLISQNVMLATGLPVDAYVKFDWYRFGYRYFVPWELGDRTVELYPCIGGALLDFHYRLSSPETEDVDRSYAKVGAQIGLGASVALTERWSLWGQVLAPLPITHTPQILSAQATARYRFLEREGLSITGLFGIGYDRISYQDGQTVPNDIEADIGPVGLLGLEIRF